MSRQQIEVEGDAMTDLDRVNTLIGEWLHETRLEAFDERVAALRGKLLEALVAVCNRLGAVRSSLTAAEENELVQRLALAEHELVQWRAGGVTEEVLRRHDGCIKIGKGVAFVRAEEYDEMRAHWAACVEPKAKSPAATESTHAGGLLAAFLDRVVQTIAHIDRVVAIEVERGHFEPRTALAAMGEVRARFAEISPRLDAVLTIHRTETAAQAAVNTSKGGA